MKRSSIKLLRTVAWSLVAISAGLLAFTLTAGASFPVGPVRVAASFTPGAGSTTLSLPPFGSVGARTHAAPLALDLRLEDVSISQVERWVTEGVPNGEYLEGLRGELLGGIARAFGVGLLAAVVLAGLVTAAGKLRRRAAAAVVAVLALGLCAVGLWGYLTFDETAFAEPDFHGALTYAPGLVSTVQERLANVDQLRSTIRAVAGDLADYYGDEQMFAGGGPLTGSIRVLHISDTHLDPVGTELAAQLAESFDVDFVVHTGDVNMYGTSVEASAAAATMITSRPVVFVPGNHDSPGVVSALAALDNVTVLEETSTVIAGITVFGVPDPVSRGFDVEPDQAQMDRLAAAGVAALWDAAGSAETTPDIIAIHNPAMQEPFAGMAEVVLSGHTHSPRLYHRDDTWWLNAGTTGGIAFGQPEGPHTAYSAAVLYFSADTQRLIAIDRIDINGDTRETSMRRTLIESGELP